MRYVVPKGMHLYRTTDRTEQIVVTDVAGSLPLHLHELLLRVAGWASDAVLTTARDHLAEGRLAEAAGAVLTAAGRDRMPMSESDLELLAALVPDDRTTAWPEAAPPGAAAEADFAPQLAGSAGTAPLVLDLTGDADRLDGPDRAAVAAVREVAGGVALWRTWRRASPGPDLDHPVRVYLLLAGGDPGGLPVACARVQRALADAGIDHPQVEAFHHRTALPPYQRLARGRSALLWAATEAQPITVARVFDAYHPATGGQFSADRPALSHGDELQRTLHYLDSGAVLLATEAREADPFDEDAGPVVPLSFRTDGSWIWTDAVSYFLRTYALSPDDALLAHIRTREYRVPEVDPVAEHRALAALLT
ncbi:hypothetical protein ACWD8I_25395 [Micromonospora arida]|uniref:SUKH-4 immunity protein n=1 Tax=Micromonospora zamorensis TaxID=709883 RepID=A0ABZ1PIT8_9ACTN